MLQRLLDFLIPGRRLRRVEAELDRQELLLIRKTQRDYDKLLNKRAVVDFYEQGDTSLPWTMVR